MSRTYKNFAPLEASALPRPLRLLARLLVVLSLGAAACGRSSTNGDLGIAIFTMSNCGGAFNNIITGCDIKKTLATGGKVDMQAVRMSNSAPLQLRSDFPTVMTVTSNGGVIYTLAGVHPGMATLVAFDGGGDVDHVTMQVDDANQIAFLEISAEGGAYTNSPGGTFDGTFTVNNGVNMFTLLFAQIDTAGNKMIGRGTFSAMLSSGLMYQSGDSNPTSLEFDLLRPAQSGNYSLIIANNVGLAGYKMQITVP